MAIAIVEAEILGGGYLPPPIPGRMNIWRFRATG